MKWYAGVGSRETPPVVAAMMKEQAAKLESLGYVLRSGGADGADLAFESGCTRKEIFLPWEGFNGNPSPLSYIPDWCYQIASLYHPGWRHLKQGAQSLMARNVQQVLGQNEYSENSRFVLCWTPDGVETTTTNLTGGTGQAIRIAVSYGIPVINMKNADWLHKLREIIK